MTILVAGFVIFVAWKVFLFAQLERAIQVGDLTKAERFLKLGAIPTQDLEDGISWPAHLIDDRKLKEAILIEKFGASLGDPNSKNVKEMFNRWTPEQRKTFTSSPDFKRFPKNWPN